MNSTINSDTLNLIRFKDVKKIIVDALDKLSKATTYDKQFRDILTMIIHNAQPPQLQENNNLFKSQRIMLNIDPEHLMYIEQEVLALLQLVAQ